MSIIAYGKDGGDLSWGLKKIRSGRVAKGGRSAQRRSPLNGWEGRRHLCWWGRKTLKFKPSHRTIGGRGGWEKKGLWQRPSGDGGEVPQNLCKEKKTSFCGPTCVGSPFLLRPERMRDTRGKRGGRSRAQEKAWGV